MKTLGTTTRITLTIAGMIAALALRCPPSYAGPTPFRATTAVSKTEVSIGESFTLQVHVTGDKRPDNPDMSGITDFSVQGPLGNMEKTVNRQVIRIFPYQLTPKRVGSLVIPPIVVRARGRTARTQPVAISVRKPKETPDLKLRMRLSKTQCYVHEPVTLSITWYRTAKVRNDFQFSLPVLGDNAFTVYDPKTGASPTSLHCVEGRERLDGKEYATIGFQKILIPKRTGELKVEPAAVTCQVVTGRRKSGRRSVFGDDVFSVFGNFPFGSRDIYTKFVVPADPVTLSVSQIPAAGRPANFAWHVGEYRIQSTATPLEVSVGDPITLTIVLSGPEYLEHIAPPCLAKQESLSRDFKIPDEMAPGKCEAGAKVFTQTIRALRADVTKIPPIELPYFNTNDGAYRVAKSGAIPVQVKATKVLTAIDAEGLGITAGASAVEKWSRGIAHNYESLDVLEDQRYGPAAWIESPRWLALLGLPPLAYIMLLVGTTIIRRRHADPVATRARKAHTELTATLRQARRDEQADPETILTAIQRYLGARLRIRSAALTFADVNDMLQARDIDTDTLEQLRRLFEQCEASRYAGNSGTADAAAMLDQAADIASELNRKLK